MLLACTEYSDYNSDESRLRPVSGKKVGVEDQDPATPTPKLDKPIDQRDIIRCPSPPSRARRAVHQWPARAHPNWPIWVPHRAECGGAKDWEETHSSRPHPNIHESRTSPAAPRRPFRGESRAVHRPAPQNGWELHFIPALIPI